jgi:N-acyl-D-aspartate/D-glutamate deacylase
VTYDTIIRNGRWFDGTGAASAVRNLGIRDGHVVAVSADPLMDERLREDHPDGAAGCPHIIDATGKWVLPGLLDIHTHYDVEVLDGPALTESLRHGVTTVMLGSCSLSTIHVDGVNAGDLFGRVEAIPREHVIDAVDRHKTWTTCDEYVHALEARPLGPNLAAFIGHSDMRTAVMGLARATTKSVSPSKGEQAEMERLDGSAPGVSCGRRTSPPRYPPRRVN